MELSFATKYLYLNVMQLSEKPHCLKKLITFHAWGYYKPWTIWQHLYEIGCTVAFLLKQGPLSLLFLLFLSLKYFFPKLCRTLYIHGHTNANLIVWHRAIEKAASTDGNVLEDQQLSKNDVPIIVNSCIAFVTQYGKWNEMFCWRCIRIEYLRGNYITNYITLAWAAICKYHTLLDIFSVDIKWHLWHL